MKIQWVLLTNLCRTDRQSDSLGSLMEPKKTLTKFSLWRNEDDLYLDYGIVPKISCVAFFSIFCSKLHIDFVGGSNVFKYKLQHSILPILRVNLSFMIVYFTYPSEIVQNGQGIFLMICCGVHKNTNLCEFLRQLMQLKLRDKIRRPIINILPTLSGCVHCFSSVFPWHYLASQVVSSHYTDYTTKTTR